MQKLTYRKQSQHEIHKPRVRRNQHTQHAVQVGPARPGHHRIPELLHRRALKEKRKGCHDEQQVRGDDDGPDDDLRLALGDVQQRDGKRRLAPGDGERRQEPDDVVALADADQRFDAMLADDVGRVLAEAGVHVDGHYGAGA